MGKAAPLEVKMSGDKVLRTVVGDEDRFYKPISMVPIIDKETDEILHVFCRNEITGYEQLVSPEEADVLKKAFDELEKQYNGGFNNDDGVSDALDHLFEVNTDLYFKFID